jgi:hypothetical protein
MEVQWKQIAGFNYCVSNIGQIFSMHTNKMLKPNISRNGYVYVVLSDGGKLTTKKIHRLVAETFIPNPNNLPQVNHIDGNKSNNAAINLEWVTAKENAEHFWNNLDNEEHRQRRIAGQQRAKLHRKTTAKRVVRLTDNKMYNSIHEAAVENGTSISLISQVCKGKRHTTAGHSWSYIEA